MGLNGLAEKTGSGGSLPGFLGELDLNAGSNITDWFCSRKLDGMLCRVDDIDGAVLWFVEAGSQPSAVVS